MWFQSCLPLQISLKLDSGQSLEVEIGIEESLESFLSQWRWFFITQLYLLPSLPPLKKPPNSIVKLPLENGIGIGIVMSCQNPQAWELM